MSLIKDKQKYFIEPLFKNMQGENYKWIRVMTKRSMFLIKHDMFYYLYSYGTLRDILTKIYIKSQKFSKRNLICSDYYLHSNLNVMKFKKACYHIKDRIKFVEYYYDCVWMSIPFISDIKRFIMGYL
jgi:formate-dependent nitrite reductase cytochrome c552 subunit